MGIETLKRIKWRLEDKAKDGLVKLQDVWIAIHEEVGLDKRTEAKYIKLLVLHKVLKRCGRWYFELPTDDRRE